MGPILGGVARLKYSSAVNVVCDGDSLTNGFGSGTPYPTQLAALAPLNSVVGVANVGISGQTIGDMTSNHDDVDGAWAAGKMNILVAWGGTNSIYFGRTAAETASDMTAYIAARRAARNWKAVLLINLIPRSLGTDEGQNAAQNAKFDAYNAILRTNFKTLGADFLVDTRQAGSPFALTGYSNADFAASASQGWWSPNEGATPTHLSTAGYGAIAQIVAAQLKRVCAR